MGRAIPTDPPQGEPFNSGPCTIGGTCLARQPGPWVFLELATPGRLDSSAAVASACRGVDHRTCHGPAGPWNSAVLASDETTLVRQGTDVSGGQSFGRNDA